MMQGHLYYFEFYDHSSSDGWQGVNATHADPERVALVGWVLYETKYEFCVAQGLHMSGPKSATASTARFHLLKSCIIKKRKIRL